MKLAVTVDDLHSRTSEIIKEVAAGDSFVIQENGKAVAELRPVSEERVRKRLPDREEYFSKQPPDPLDSGRILEEDRT